MQYPALPPCWRGREAFCRPSPRPDADLVSADQRLSPKYERTTAEEVLSS